MNFAVKKIETYIMLFETDISDLQLPITVYTKDYMQSINNYYKLYIKNKTKLGNANIILTLFCNLQYNEG